jgi:23S rRNA (adenine1618-N6)-methyltransferase
MKKQIKPGLHTRNSHNSSYDFDKLIVSCPELAPFVKRNKYKNLSINFSKPEAVLALNKALLMHFYDVTFWEFPKENLCPPIPGRADYIHYMADLLASSNDGVIPKGRNIRGIDVGVGANCIYPILGNKIYGWEFLGIDIDRMSIKAAKEIVKKNLDLNRKIKLQFQKNPRNIFTETIQTKDLFDFTICNPPFHSSAKEAKLGSMKKIKNLNKEDNIESKGPVLNFAGKNSELCCPGGESAFIKRMIKQSVNISKNVFWFSSLVSKKENLPHVYEKLKAVKVTESRTIEMNQGAKKSRLVAWTFLTNKQQEMWKETHWKKKNLR